MLAKINQSQINKFKVYTLTPLPESTEDIFKKIGDYQLTLQNFFTKGLAVPEKKSSIHLKMFLNESKNRLHIFILTFNEIIGQVSLLPLDNSSIIKDLSYSSDSFIFIPKIINEIFINTTHLCEMFTQLKDKIEQAETSVLIKDFCMKSLIFYKQTLVVLKGYLRTAKVQ